MTDESQRDQFATRRCVLLGAGLLGAAGTGVVLAGCSTAPVPYDANEFGQAPGTEPTAQAAAAAAGGSADGGGAMSGKQAGTLLGSAADIPVGGGVAYTSAQVVVTQPTKGVYKGFSAVCTHVGCICNRVADGTIDCPCHGSKFKITDGAVVTGPADAPLPTKNVKVTGGKVYLV